MQSSMITRSTGCACSKDDESDSAAGWKLGLLMFDCGFTEPSSLWQLPRWEVPWGSYDIPGTMSRRSIRSRNVVGVGPAVSSSVCGWMTDRTHNSNVPYFLSPLWQWSAASSHSSCVNSSSVVCFCQNLSKHCGTVLVIVPIPQLGMSSSLNLPCSVSSLSWSSPCSASSELTRSLKLSPITNIISSNVCSGSLFVNPMISSCYISSCSCWTAASVSSTRFLAPAVSLSTKLSMHFCFSSLLRKCVSRHFSGPSFVLDLKLCNAPLARTLSASKPLLPSFTWWHHWVDHCVDLLYLPAEGGEKCFFGALTIVDCIDFVVGRDVVCCKIWTIWRQTASFISRFVHLLIKNKAKPPFWLSIEWE